MISSTLLDDGTTSAGFASPATVEHYQVETALCISMPESPYRGQVAKRGAPGAPVS
jgi:hypothetical protein